MRTITKTYNVYEYRELSDDAKNKVKKWYLDDPLRTDIFTEMVEEDLRVLFDTKLNVQYSLSYCQGDGLNIYGDISAGNIRNCLQKHNGGQQLEQFEDWLTEKEWRRILHYADQCDVIHIPCNRRYCYCIANLIDIYENWYNQLLDCRYSHIDTKTLKKFEKLVIAVFYTLCRGYEKSGYEHFYDVSEEEMIDACEAKVLKQFLVYGFVIPLICA